MKESAFGETGQVILVLILVMTVALAIGLSVVQKSLVDVSTSSRIEQSSRAFSAAEAAIEKTLQTGTADPDPLVLQNLSEATITDSGLLPKTAALGTTQAPLEVAPPGAPLSKDEVAQVHLADLNSSSTPPANFYTQNSLDVYWGNSSTDRAAITLTLVYWNSTSSAFQSRKWYLDHSTSRNPPNGFESVPCNETTLAGYQCYKKLDSLPANLMLLRARLLYNIASQPFAVQAVGTCGLACSLPPQIRILTSTGVSGPTQRRIQLMQQLKVIPSFFDYAIFSAGDISK